MEKEHQIRFQEFLEDNQKNINDLIGQEINIILLANFILENPTLEKQIDTIFHKIYLNVYRLIRDSFLHLAQDLNLSSNYIESTVQEVVNDIINQKKEQVWSMLSWLEKMKK